uniref:Transmembrane protein n=1 Tax=Clandestinovirus TaxID=2831644 RepID=A0A8F8KP59_9VIRU|nr:transmembrane protein [Clandestinovirus]
MQNILEYSPMVPTGNQVTSDDSIEVEMECKGEVVYTPEMSMQPELRQCYAEYLQTKDKRKYYACVRDFIASKVRNMDADSAQMIIRGLGLSDKRNMTIRLCQSYSGSNRSIDVFHHILMPFFVVGGVGVMILKNKCGRTMAPTELYLSASALGFAGSIVSVVSNLLS